MDDAWRKQLTSGNGAWIELEELPEGEDLYLEGVTIELTTGKAVGKPMLLDKMIREPGKKSGYLTIGLCYGMTDIAEVIGSIDTRSRVPWTIPITSRSSPTIVIRYRRISPSMPGISSGMNRAIQRFPRERT